MSRAFAIWMHPERLADELDSIVREFPQTKRVAVTMTAELADCFATKSEGVRFILDAVEAGVANNRPRHRACPGGSAASALLDESQSNSSSAEASEPPGQARWRGDITKSPVLVWTTDGRFVSASEACEQPMLVAAANWHALATWVGREFLSSTRHSPLVTHPSSLLIDIGTTTTDIIPLVDGRPVARGLTDVGRLQTGELSYSGVKRTPLCAIAHAVPFQNGYCPLAAELFATTLDVYLLLGGIASNETDLDTANGKPATVAAAHDRLARMLCCDRDEVSFEEAVQVARFLADVQRQRLAGSLERVASQLPGPCQTVVVSGSGAFLARRLVSENRRTATANIISLDDRLSPEIAEAACAYAVAQLLAGG
ncbi:MAG: hydantoinase/oxoprolinase family protein [Planctomycetota bacterium]